MNSARYRLWVQLNRRAARRRASTAGESTTGDDLSLAKSCCSHRTSVPTRGLHAAPRSESRATGAFGGHQGPRKVAQAAGEGSQTKSMSVRSTTVAPSSPNPHMDVVELIQSDAAGLHAGEEPTQLSQRTTKVGDEEEGAAMWSPHSILAPTSQDLRKLLDSNRRLRPLDARALERLPRGGGDMWLTGLGSSGALGAQGGLRGSETVEEGAVGVIGGGELSGAVQPGAPGVSAPKTLYEKQLKIETQTIAEACEKYKRLLTDMLEMQKFADLKPGKQLLLKWFEPVTARIAKEQLAFRHGQRGHPDSKLIGPIISVLGPDKLAIITMHCMLNLTVNGGERGASFTNLCMAISEAVQGEIMMNVLAETNEGKGIVNSLKRNGTLNARHVNLRARYALERDDWKPDIKVKVGGFLVQILMDLARDQHGQPVFVHTHRNTGTHRTGYIVCSKELIVSMMGIESTDFLNARNLPMVVEPRPWKSWNDGGFLKLKTPIMRTHGSGAQIEALSKGNIDRVLDSLTGLGKVPWRINERVFNVVKDAWEQGQVIGDLPSQTDFPDVPEPSLTGDEEADKAILLEYNMKVKRTGMRNADLHSLRCDTNIKLGIADQFVGDQIYFPYNLDFRGRAYPVPPNLNHLGSDMSRGMLQFARPKPIGERGLFWMKVHVANLFGYDKASFKDREEWTEAHLPEIFESARNPLDGSRWWAKGDSPWQLLGMCMELERVLSSPNPAECLSAIPVHMDGSCNGLQHYAALGRDEEGGRQVNLIAGPKPGDVYSGVCKIVVEKVRAAAERTPQEGDTVQMQQEHEYANLVKDLIDRKVVKQTVMTSVYGVTYTGARRQIQNRLEEKLVDLGYDSTEAEQHAFKAAAFVATITMEAMKELFTGARLIMEWLGTCARTVAHSGQPMSWVTPMGLPVMQPYRRVGNYQVKTLVQTVVLTASSDDLAVHTMKQRTAFPPNFVHSLDSTHMMTTALRMNALKMDFTAVHDSYWAHPCNIDAMNDHLREAFVELYSQPVLENLKEDLELRFPECDFPDIPERGTLDLQEVLHSPYFFN